MVESLSWLVRKPFGGVCATPAWGHSDVLWPLRLIAPALALYFAYGGLAQARDEKPKSSKSSVGTSLGNSESLLRPGVTRVDPPLHRNCAHMLLSRPTRSRHLPPTCARLPPCLRTTCPKNNPTRPLPHRLMPRASSPTPLPIPAPAVSCKFTLFQPRRASSHPRWHENTR